MSGREFFLELEEIVRELAAIDDDFTESCLALRQRAREALGMTP